MRYYKIVDDGVVIRIGIGNDGVEITESEYNTLLEEAKNIVVEEPVEIIPELTIEERLDFLEACLMELGEIVYA